MRVFITGGTGLVGSRLVARLAERGDSAVVLSRSLDRARSRLGSDVEVVEGDPTVPGRWSEALGSCEAVVNLAGENIFAQRWNEGFKAKIHDSRVGATRNVVAAILQAPEKPAVLVNASAIGFYGPQGDGVLTESDPPGNDFLAHSCTEWEASAREVQAASVRLVIVRTGVVLSTEEGALAKMLTPFKLGVGGPVGSGRQWMSWIHNDDLATVLIRAINDTGLSGPLNGTAPEPVTNKGFARALGAALGRPSFLPLPAFMLRVMLGRVAEIVTGGQRVLPARLIALGHPFRFPTIQLALEDLLKRG